MAESTVFASLSKSRPRPLTPVIYGVMVIGLLALIAAELFFSVRQESQVFDESTHLFAGFEYWMHGDFGRNPEHPPLVKLIAAAPLLTLHLKEPGVVPGSFFKLQDFVNARQFLYSADADSLLMRGRIMIALFSLGLAFAVFAAAHEMFGREVALLALALLAVEPVILANGALITTDIPLACLFFLSVYTFCRYVKRPSVLRLAVCTFATAFVPIAKHSGILIFPVLALLAVWEILQCRKATADSRSVRRKAAHLAAVLAVIAVASYVILWAIYGFRYAARPGGLQMTPSLNAYAAGLPSAAQKALISFLARHHLFPEAYLYGWVDILLIPASRATFIFGKIYAKGQWFFFPAVFLIKSTIPLLVLLVCVPFAGLSKRNRELAFLAIPAVCFLLFSMLSHLNLGVRHILPIYPFLFVLAAAAGWGLAARSRSFAIALAALLVFAAASSLHSFPDYLAYSNEAFGGPSNTYRLVTAPNSDWGQELKWVKQYLDKNQVSECWFDNYNAAADPKYYGIGCKPLVSSWSKFFPGSELVPTRLSGTVLISATELEGLNWGPGTLNPYDQFKRLRPDSTIENIVLVYRGTFDVPLVAAYSHYSAANVLASQRKMPEAIAEAQAAAELAPDSAVIQAGLGRLLIAAGQKEEGRQKLATALHLAQTNHPDYQAGLIRQIEQASR